MTRNRFVDPDVTRLPISEGDFIDVKARLTHGEREDYFSIIGPYDATGQTAFDRRLVRTAKVLAYLVGWSLTRNGQPVPMSPELSATERESTVRALDTDTFDEIYAAISAHEEKVNKERVARKNTQAGETASPAISPSPADCTGDMNGSAH